MHPLGVCRKCLWHADYTSKCRKETIPYTALFTSTAIQGGIPVLLSTTFDVSGQVDDGLSDKCVDIVLTQHILYMQSLRNLDLWQRPYTEVLTLLSPFERYKSISQCSNVTSPTFDDISKAENVFQHFCFKFSAYYGT